MTNAAVEEGNENLEPYQFGLLYGEVISELPDDLYIPPDALEVILEAFEGPLDLLLYLIRRQNLDILSISIADITEQYMEYVELMKSANFELAAEYLVMAAWLGEIKSRTLLPRPAAEDEDEDVDPRAELLRRLQEYERFKKAAEDIDALPRNERDTHIARAHMVKTAAPALLAETTLEELLDAFRGLLHRADMFESHHITREPLSTRERMSRVLEQIKGQGFVSFHSLFSIEEGRSGVVVTFLAIMELVKTQLIEIVQSEFAGPLHIRSKVLQDELHEA
ncbi:MAG TPA: ScpA family protein [Alcanivoracaceae bacterium]|nr:ScpA family protein [Alcanivoracaceae bacterium]